MPNDDEVRAYDGSRARIIAMLRDADPDQLTATVPCCPSWTVKDLAGHLAGLLEDRDEGRLPTGEMGAWTRAQVERHRAESLDEVLACWQRHHLDGSERPPSPPTVAFDVVTHEHDLAEALGVHGDRDSLSVDVGVQRAVARLASVLEPGGAPSVVLRTEDGERVLAGAAGTIGLRTGRFQLLRLVAGRMSERQAASLDWDGNPAPVLHALFADGFFRLQAQDTDAVRV